ncbi:MAG: GTPase HflX [Acidaminococcaceae bacterium]
MNEIHGNKKGIKNAVLLELEKLYAMQVPLGQIISAELACKLADISEFINREISLYITRSGQVTDISIGTQETVELPDFEGRRGTSRLSGIRCVHTHLNGNSMLSGVDYAALKNTKFDAMITIGVIGPDYTQSVLSFGMITSIDENGQYQCEEYGPLSLSDAEQLYFPNIVTMIERILEKQSGGNDLATMAERAILVAMEWNGSKSLWTMEDSLEELKQLADTAGALVIAKFTQKRPKPDPAFFVGKGKAQELALYVQQENIDICIFDDELSPAQQRNLEQVMGIRILDRTGLILDIFAQRARTNEGKLQVELAQLQYNLPRMAGKGMSLSRLGGGIGTRGPGETKLEVDRRRIRDRITFIKESIDKVKSVRTLHRSNRNKNQVPTVSLVGYTNAGKSTLLNILTASDIYAQDQLFATLDPTTRQLSLPDKQEAILTDTVGFIQRLPHQLVAAFRSTLEEVVESDILLHVVDVSHALYNEQSEAVYTVLKEIGAVDKTTITVFNKIDKLPADSELLTRLTQVENSVCISAKTGTGLGQLLELIVENLNLKSAEVTLLIPYAETDKAAKLHEISTVLEQEYMDTGVRIKARVAATVATEYANYIII